MFAINFILNRHEILYSFELFSVIPPNCFSKASQFNGSIPLSCSLTWCPFSIAFIHNAYIDQDQSTQSLFFKGAFSLENATGILRINSPISNYTNESLTVNIFARDNGSPSWNTPAKLHIYFANILKSAPIFEKHVFRASIKEVAVVICHYKF